MLTETLEKIRRIKTPEPTSTWAPIPHFQFIELVRQGIDHYGVDIVKETFTTSKGGDRLFGIFDIKHDKETMLQVGFRNSHDKSLPAQLVLGNKVMVCSNMMFFGENKVSRKHTLNMETELPLLIQRSVGHLLENKTKQLDGRMTAYKSAKLSTDAMSNHLAVTCAKAGVYNPAKILRVLEEFEKPSYKEQNTGSVYNFMQAVTWTLKERLEQSQNQSVNYADSTIKLTRILDSWAGFNN